MENIQILDKSFKIYLTEKDITNRVAELAHQINVTHKGEEIVVVGILNGCFMFASDLFKQLDLQCRISFLKLASYQGTQSTGKIRQLIGLNEDIKEKTVIILEDIIDTGITMEHIINQLNAYNPSDIKIATLLFKPEAFQKDFPIDYTGFEIPDKFIVGYGLDYNGLGRNLRQIYQIK
ncbi:MAG: hypoxanthine phosphoribosyltransferase [Candidatus Delongbacteria bacterium]|jgi:hypoxanthine phosphoribosyltransferase|nr:hypoxanthine phosphoribosyltransferase [Candidatus Delongbacteria bacterium]